VRSRVLTGVGIAAAIACLSLLTYFQFPGHTYLQQDTQIYVPILEHLWDGSVLSQDLLVQRPHVAFTLYDELALGLRRATGLGFHSILTGLQILTRGLGLWGIYLIAMYLLGDRIRALLVAGIFALGAAIDGPAVLVTEYEPSPRAFAIPLVFLAMGLAAWGRTAWAGTAAAAGFCLHPPSAVAYWLAHFWRERKWTAWVPLAAGAVVLAVAAWAQPGIKESQPFFSRITPELERLMRMRASYNWVSMWWRTEWWKHCLALVVSLAGYWRVKKLGEFFVGLPVLGLMSVPASYLLLEGMKWGLMPQLQPTRTLLFTTAAAVLLAAVCGCLAAGKRNWLEAYGWFFVSVVPPLVWGQWWLAAGLAAALTLAAGFRWAIAPALLACYLAIPGVGHVSNYPAVHTPELASLSAWAAANTPKDAVFLFPGAGKRPGAGVFRSEALRAVYVDWKGGGQLNYLPEFGAIWWERWQAVMFQPVDFGKYKKLGIGYAVLPHGGEIAGARPVYRNPGYTVYSVLAEAP
jgi:hypothetical protein